MGAFAPSNNFLLKTELFEDYILILIFPWDVESQTQTRTHWLYGRAQMVERLLYCLKRIIQLEFLPHIVLFYFPCVDLIHAIIILYNRIGTESQGKHCHSAQFFHKTKSIIRLWTNSKKDVCACFWLRGNKFTKISIANMEYHNILIWAECSSSISSQYKIK